MIAYIVLMPKPITPIEERFFNKIEKTDKCWIWKASTQGGYGQLWCIKRKRAIRAHIISYEIHNGKIPKGMCVCHSCDNPPCVNPLHLWLGTHAENMRDGFKKGRIKNTNPSNGERHWNAKMTWGKVREIRKTNLPRYGRNKILAKQYGVHVQIIKRILNNRNWIEC